MTGLILRGFKTKQKIEFTVERDRAPAYTQLSDGSIRNAVTLRLLNKNSAVQGFDIVVTGPDALEVGAVGRTVEDRTINLDIIGDKQVQMRMFLTLPAEIAAQRDPITLIATNQVTGETVTRTITFVSGGGS